MTQVLSNTHQKTYDAILRHPAAHNLQWREVRAMLAELAEVVEEPNGHIKVSRNGQTLTLHPEGQKDVGTEEQLKMLRAFLVRSEEGVKAPGEKGLHLLVVIDHREARVYKTELRGTVPQRIVPHDTGSSLRYLHVVEEGGTGQRREEKKEFYEAIAKVLHGAAAVLIFGGGTGASSAMEHLVSELDLRHKDISAKVVGAVVVDEHHLSEDQLLARAREFYAEMGQAV